VAVIPHRGKDQQDCQDGDSQHHVLPAPDAPGFTGKMMRHG
jgi:hypothetical protein